MCQFVCVYKLYVCIVNFIIVLEVYQFARDAAVAESWLMAQEPYLLSREYGVSFKFFNNKRIS